VNISDWLFADLRIPKAWLRREGKDEKTEFMTLGDSMYMVSCEEAKAGDYLGMSFTIQR
jgi:hypothetical protein